VGGALLENTVLYGCYLQAQVGQGNYFVMEKISQKSRKYELISFVITYELN
jgi:hypothetical protein